MKLKPLLLSFLLISLQAQADGIASFVPRGWMLGDSYPSPTRNGIWPWNPLQKSALTFQLASLVAKPDSESTFSDPLPAALVLRKGGELLPLMIDLAELPQAFRRGLIHDAASISFGKSRVIQGKETIPFVASVFHDNHIEHKIYLLNEFGEISQVKLELRPTIEIVEVGWAVSSTTLQIQITFKETTGPYNERKNLNSAAFTLGEPAFYPATPNLPTNTSTRLAFAWAVAAVRSSLFGSTIRIDDPELFLQIVGRWGTTAKSKQLHPENLYALILGILENSSTSSVLHQDGKRVHTLHLLETEKVCKWIADYGLPK